MLSENAGVRASYPRGKAVVSEADACLWLNRRVSLIASRGPAATGRVRHVSSRAIFLLHEDQRIAPFGGSIRAVPLIDIVRIVAAETEAVGR